MLTNPFIIISHVYLGCECWKKKYFARMFSKKKNKNKTGKIEKFSKQNLKKKHKARINHVTIGEQNWDGRRIIDTINHRPN